MIDKTIFPLDYVFLAMQLRTLKSVKYFELRF